MLRILTRRHIQVKILLFLIGAIILIYLVRFYLVDTCFLSLDCLPVDVELNHVTNAVKQRYINDLAKQDKMMKTYLKGNQGSQNVKSFSIIPVKYARPKDQFSKKKVNFSSETLSCNVNRHKCLTKKYLMNVSAQSCEPLFPQVVLYNRIFKTASTAITNFFERCGRKLKFHVKKESTEEWSNEKSSHPILRRIKKSVKKYRRKGIKRFLAVSHFYFRKETGLGVKHTYINLLRDPVERFISHYYHARSPKRLPWKLKRLKSLGQWNVTLDECLVRQFEGCQWNTMTRFFCGPEAKCKAGMKALSQAKHNIRQYYASVGVVEHLNEFAQILHKRLPRYVNVYIPNLRRKLINKGARKQSVSKEMIKRIRNANNADIHLYKYVKALFLKQAKDCGIKIVNERATK